jgi:hypothetical protein
MSLGPFLFGNDGKQSRILHFSQKLAAMLSGVDCKGIFGDLSLGPLICT